MGSYRRLPRLWRAGNGYLYIVYSDRGRWIRRSTRTTKMAAAQEQLRTFLESGGAQGGAAQRQSLGDAAVEWATDRALPMYGLSATTAREYRLTVDRITAAPIARLSLDEVRPNDVREFLARLGRKGATPGALARVLLHVRMLFRWLQRQERVHSNPAELIETPKIQRGRRPAFRPEQFAEMRAAARADVAAATTQTARREAQLLVDLLDALWLSGLRSIEAIRLQWQDVDLEARTWRIRSPANKGGDQVMPLHPDLVPLLRRRRIETAAEVGPFVGEWHVRNAWRRFKSRHPEWAGWSLHSLRHGFVTRVRAAAGDAAASHLARHKSKAMTEHYSHFDQETFRSALEGI